MLSFSHGLKLATMGVGGLAQVMNGGVIRIYSGSRPISATAGIPPSTECRLIGRITTEGKTFEPGTDPEFAGLALSVNNEGTISLVGDWVLTAIADGEPKWFRWCWYKYDDDALSTFFPRLDGDIGPVEDAGELWSVGDSVYDMVLPYRFVTTGMRLHMNSFILKMEQ